MQNDSQPYDRCLQNLTQQLQGHIQRYCPVRLVVRCAIWKQHLVVLGTHAADARVASAQMFSVMAEALAEIVLAPLPNCSGQVQLCLKISGQSRIYATHRLQLQALSSTSFFPKEIASESSSPVSTAEGLGVRANLPREEGLGIRVQLPVKERVRVRAAVSPRPSSSSPRAENPAVCNTSRKLQTSQRSSKRSRLLQTIALVPLLLSSAYLLTRPCVIGSCPLLQTSQQTNQQIRQQIRQATTGTQLKQARSQLTALVASLQPIPVWSPHHRQAARQLQAYQAQARNLDRLVVALDRAALAQRQLKPPHSLAEWVILQSLWRGAINRLVQIPPDSTAYSLAATKLPTYRVALAEIDRRYATEQQATNQLAEAKRIAQIAAARQEIAQNPESWQFVKTTWLSAVKQLQTIPKTTLANQEATVLLSSYQRKVDNAHHQHTIETAMATTYQAATDLAQQAKTLEQQQQWSDAYQAWQGAIAHAQKIPTTSFYYQQAQALITAYKTRSPKQASL